MDADNTNPKEDKKQKLPGNDEEKGDLGGLNSPDLDEKTGKPKRRAIDSFSQAYSLCKRLYDRARTMPGGRLAIAAMIAEKYGGAAPFQHADLQRTGQLWRNNFSTNPLASVVDRSTPQLTDPVKETETLTYSELPPQRENAGEKTRKFRLRTTKLIRSWEGWVSCVNQITQSDYLLGNSGPGWIDDDWRPRAFRYDETYLPDGSGQHAKEQQFIIYRVPVLLHNFIQKLEDKEIAEEAGYDWDGCIKSANEAAGLRSRGDMNPMDQADAWREQSTIGFTYEQETKIVWQYILLVREYEGGVCMWVTDAMHGHPIRYVKNIHEKMEDACCLFTIQEGNGKFYGSKGCGRMLTNIHIALDRSRCFNQDAMNLTGALVVNSDKPNEVMPIVRYPFIILKSGVTVTKEQVNFDAQGAQIMDQKLQGWMEEIAGAFIPPRLDDAGSPNTKIEAAAKETREMAVKAGVVGRYFGQMGNLVSAMQRKIYKPENLKEGLRLQKENKAKAQKGIMTLPKQIWDWLKDVMSGSDDVKSEPEEQSIIADQEAVQAIVDLLEDGLTVQDITELALDPAGNDAEVSSAAEDGKAVEFLNAKIADPYYDAVKTRRVLGERVVGKDLNDQVQLPDKPDPNVEAIATREQLMEWTEMNDGEDMPVAQTDNHRIHRQVLIKKMMPPMQLLLTAPTPEVFQIMKLAFQHYVQHWMMDKETPPDVKKQEHTAIEQWQKDLTEAGHKLEQLAKKAAEAGVQGGPNALPPPIGGAEPGQPGPQPVTGEESLEHAKFVAETALRAADIKNDSKGLDIKQQELELKAKMHADKDHSDTLKDLTDRSTEIASKAADAQMAGVQDAKDALQAQQEAAQQPPPGGSAL